MRGPRANDAVDTQAPRPRPGGHAAAAVRRPLEAWRSLGRGDVGPVLVRAVRRALGGPVSVHDRRWPRVLRGDAAAAVGVAVRFLHRHDPATAPGDLVMSAVFVHAVSCDAAAALVLARGLATLARGRHDADELIALAFRWASASGRVPPPFRA